VEEATTTLSDIKDKIEGFFTFSSTETWDCTIDFSSVPFAGTYLEIGKVDLCEHWGFGITLIKELLKFLSLVIAVYIVMDGLGGA